MKTFFHLVIAILIVACTPGKHKNKVPVKYTVSGTIFELRQYCGGARPSEEILHPKPLAVHGITLYIRKTLMNSSENQIIDSVVSGFDGSFSIQLPAGTYCFIEAAKKAQMKMPVNDQYNTYDTACYRKNYNTCDFSVDVKSNISKIEIVLERRCPWNRPCVQYKGPLPPSAPPVNGNGHQPGHQE